MSFQKAPAGAKDEIRFAPGVLRAFLEAVTLKADRKAGLIPKAEYERRKNDLIGAFAALDAQIANAFPASGLAKGRQRVLPGARVVRNRPLAYLPTYNSGGKVRIVDAATYARADAVGGNQRKSVHADLMPVFGAKHLAIMGFVTRNRRVGRTGRPAGLDYSSPLRAYQRRTIVGQKGPKDGTYGYYLPAQGKPVAITANTCSRIMQLAAKGDIQGAFRGVGYTGPMTFRLDKGGLAPGEDVRVISNGRGGSRRAIVKLGSGAGTVARFAGGFRSARTYQEAVARGARLRGFRGGGGGGAAVFSAPAPSAPVVFGGGQVSLPERPRKTATQQLVERGGFRFGGPPATPPPPPKKGKKTATQQLFERGGFQFGSALEMRQPSSFREEILEPRSRMEIGPVDRAYEEFYSELDEGPRMRALMNAP